MVTSDQGKTGRWAASSRADIPFFDLQDPLQQDAVDGPGSKGL